MGRFINADALVSTGQGLLGNNMFAYCNNNPVMFADSHGNSPFAAILWPVLPYVAAGILTVMVLVASYYVVSALFQASALVADLVSEAWVAHTSHTEEPDKETLPQQGNVTDDPEAPPVDAGKQGKHVPGHNNYDDSKSSWPEGQNGVSQTQEAWQNGVEDPKVPSGKVRIGISSDGTVVRVHMDGKGAIHGYPLFQNYIN